MGYKRKTMHLAFEDKPGLDIYIHSLSVKKALRVMRLASEMTGAASGDVSEEEAMKMAEELFGAFASRLVSWSLVEDDDDETPVPLTLESLLDWDFDEAMFWVLTWVNLATSIAVPTTVPATGTGNPLEASIPMASASGM